MRVSLTIFHFRFYCCHINDRPTGKKERNKRRFVDDRKLMKVTSPITNAIYYICVRGKKKKNRRRVRVHEQYSTRNYTTHCGG